MIVSLSGYYLCQDCGGLIRGLERAARHVCKTPQEEPVHPEPDPEPEQPQIVPDDRRAFWQKVTNQCGETLLVLPHRCPKLCAEGKSLPYGVLLSVANDWEQKNFILKLQPENV